MNQEKIRKIVKYILIVVIILFVIYIIKTLYLQGITSEITGIDKYNKSYYIENYGGDLDSNLSIFPDDTSKMIDPKFSSSLKSNLFDSDGYILLNAKYNKEDFDNEIKRLSALEMSISNCKGSIYTNYVIYDDSSYKYPAYITIDGFDSIYEYALIDKENLLINYIYLSYPDVNNSNYKEYLKNDKNEYLKINTLDKYSMYNHSFDNKESWHEFDDCI